MDAARFDKLAVEFWKEYREAVRPIEDRYGMGHYVGGYDYEEDVMSKDSERWGWASRSVHSIEGELESREPRGVGLQDR